MDEISIWSRELSSDDVADLYNSGSGAGYGDLFSGDTNYVASNIGQTNNTRNNTNTTIGISCTPDTNLYLWYDTSDPPSTLVLENSSIHHYNTSNSDDTYYWKAGCYDPDTGAVEGNVTGQWELDSVTPLTTINSNNIFDASNVTTNQETHSILINLTTEDTGGLNAFEINISKSGEQYFFENTSISGTSYTYNKSIHTSNWTAGDYLVSIQSGDSHTKKKIKDYRTEKYPRFLKYQTDENINIEIESEDLATTDTWKKEDRYLFDFDFADKKNKRVFHVRSNQPIRYLKDSDYPAHFVIMKKNEKGELEGNWVDFAGIEGIITVKKLNDYHYTVTIKNKLFKDLPQKMTFNSIGGLNIETREFIYTRSYTAPSVSLTNPSGETYPLNATIAINASFTDATNLSNATLYIWNSSSHLVNSSEIVSLSGASDTASVIFYPEYESLYYWNYLATDVYDTSGFATSNKTFRVSDTVYSPNPPLINSISITPSTPLGYSTLQGFVNGTSNSNNSNASYEWIWYKEGILNSTWEDADTEYCYQETANESTSCGGLDTGFYSFDQGDPSTMTINYTVPNGTNNIIYQVKTNNLTNHSIPMSAIQEGRITFKVYSDAQGGGTFNRGAKYWNGSNWITLKDKYDDSGTYSIGGANTANLYDGDYSTGSMDDLVQWAGGNGNRGIVFEEAIFWGIAPERIDNVNINLANITLEGANVGENWTFSARALFNNTYSEWSNATVTVSEATLYKCSDANATAIKFKIFNENIPSTFLNGTIEIDGTFWLPDSDIITEVNLSYSTADEFNLCIAPQDIELYADLYIKYDVSTGFTQRWFLVNESLTNDTQTILMGNEYSTVGISDLSITLRNKYTFNFYPNIITQLQRRYVGEGVWRTVQMDESGSFGLVFFNIREEDTDYRLIYSDRNNTILKTTTSLKFICTSGVCEVTQKLDPYVSSISSNTPRISHEFNNDTQILTVHWDVPTGESINIDTTVSKETLAGTVDICTLSGSGSAGSLTCNASGHNGMLMYNTLQDGIPVASSYVENPGPEIGNLINTAEATIWTFGMMVTIISTGAVFGPVGGIIATIISILFVFFLGILNAITLTVVIVACVIGIALAIKLRT